jgi:NTP-dependent ternary system trypsin peptidase co-occuring protein
MSSDFSVSNEAPSGDGQATGADRRLVPMKVGAAVVYVEATGDEPILDEESSEFHTVGLWPRNGLNPTDAFETASEALKECVKVVGERVTTLGETITPEEVAVEFTITFDVEGAAHIVPVLLTGKAKTALGIKVSAKWNPAGHSK